MLPSLVVATIAVMTMQVAPISYIKDYGKGNISTRQPANNKVFEKDYSIVKSHRVVITFCP